MQQRLTKRLVGKHLTTTAVVRAAVMVAMFTLATRGASFVTSRLYSRVSRQRSLTTSSSLLAKQLDAENEVSSSSTNNQPMAASTGAVMKSKKTTTSKKRTTKAMDVKKKPKRSSPQPPFDPTIEETIAHTPPTETIEEHIANAPSKETLKAKQSTSPITSEAAVHEDPTIEFHNTTHFFANEDNIFPHPKSLSPSSISEFEKCPQSFFFQYILGIKQPRNAALAKGTMAHAALEQFLALPTEHRDITVLHNLFRKEWSQHRNEAGYKELFPEVSDEIEWGTHGLHLLSNYYLIEPQVLPPNPVQRERWVTATLGNKEEQILVRGIIDRLDLVSVESSSSVATRIVDYKTGCAPHLKYSPAMNEKIRKEAFDQLIIYALLLRGATTSSPIRYLRLLYLQSVGDGPAVTWDYDLGEDRDAILEAMEDRILNVYRTIVEKLESPDPFHAFAGCNRSFCFCHKCRTKFAEGLVWEPPAPLPDKPNDY